MKMLRKTFNKRKSTSGCKTPSGQFSVRHISHKWEFKHQAVTFFTLRDFTTKDTENVCKGVASHGVSAHCCGRHAVLVQDGPVSRAAGTELSPGRKSFYFFFSPIDLLGFGVGQLKPAVKAVGWKKVGVPRRFALLIMLYADCHF